MKKKDEVACSPTGDDTCVSSLISSVLTLIISILVWLQKVGCNNTNNTKNCPDIQELSSTLEKLSCFARQADAVGASVSETKNVASVGASVSQNKNVASAKPSRDGNDGKHSKKVKSDEFKNSKKSKSDENYAVLYAVSQDDQFKECRKCCNKVVEPKEKKEDNVIFEVVAAEMVANETQTSITELKDDFTQPEETNVEEKQIESKISCICVSTQKAVVEQCDKSIQYAVEATDESIQVEDDSKMYQRNQQEEISDAGNAEEEEEGEGDDDEDDDDGETDVEDYNDSNYYSCPARCTLYSQSGQMPVYARQVPYNRGQLPMRQQRPPMYYEAQMYKPQYSPAYHSNEAFAPMRYAYQPQPYYQKITRTIQRGVPSTPQRSSSPTQRPKISQEYQQGPGVEKFSQSEPTPQPPPVKPTKQPLSKNERDQPVSDKKCEPDCIRNKPPQKVTTPPSPVKEPDVKSQRASPPTSEKPPPAKEPQKRCTAKCSKSVKTNSSEIKKSQSQSQPISFMPKGAIPVDPRDVTLEVEKVPDSKQETVADSYISVESAKRKK